MVLKKKSVLILCTGNSARSQMAEGLLKDLAFSKFDIESAGTKPSSVRPEAIAVLAEIDIDISDHRSKSVDEFASQEFDLVLTVCDSASENCPYFPARTKVIHRSFEDPAAVEGSPDERLKAFRTVRDQINKYLTSEFVPIISKL